MSLARSPPRFDRIAAPLVAGATFLLALAAFTWRTSLGGPLYDFALLPSRIPLETAGADPLLVVASVGIGQSWLYLTGPSAALLSVGLLLALLGSRLGAVLGALLAGGAAGTLVRVEGCHCGAGSTSYLLEFAV